MEFHFGFFIFQLCLHLLVERKEFWFLCGAVLRMALGRVNAQRERLNTQPDQTTKAEDKALSQVVQTTTELKPHFI